MNGPRIAELIKARSLDVVETAKLADISTSFMYNIIAGRKTPSVEVAVKISNILGVTVNELAVKRSKRHEKSQKNPARKGTLATATS